MSLRKNEVKAGHFDLSGSWTSRNKNAVFFAEIQIQQNRLLPNRKKKYPLQQAFSKWQPAVVMGETITQLRPDVC